MPDLTRPRPRPRRATSLAAVLLAAGALATGVQSTASSKQAAARSQHRPIEDARDGYVTSRQCRACHPAQYRSWHRSYHRTMTHAATADHVFGDFGVTLDHLSGRYALSQDGDDFQVTITPRADVATQSADASSSFPIVLVTGSHHMQVYWYETGEARKLGQLPFMYLKNEARWIPRRAAFLRPPSNPRMAEHGRWNADCIGCHATHGKPRAGRDGSYDTRVGELGIACEACHGPGLSHVRHQASPMARYVGYFDEAPPDEIVQPADLNHERASQICSHCHAIALHKDPDAQREANLHGHPYRPGQDAEATRMLFQPSRKNAIPGLAAVVDANPDYVRGQFWPDGMARTSGREFNGMIESPCYARGELSCLSCHRMHSDAPDGEALDAWANTQLGDGMGGDQGCVQCHTARAKNIEAHTHHGADSPGSRCYNCHMPYTSFALLRAMRSHQVSSPDTTTTLHTGRPNACNLCHLDRPLAWTAEHLERWYGTPVPFLGDDQRALSSALTWALQGDAVQRALIAHAMGWGPAKRASGEQWMAPVLGLLMDDPYDAVRIVAERSLRELEAFSDFDYAFDYVQPPTERAPAVDAVREHWRRHRGDAPSPAAVPIGSDGLDAELVQRLLSRRDQRPITILE